MDPVSPYNAGTDRNESKGDRLTRLRAFTTYAEELKAYYFVHFCLRVQNQQEYLEDSRRLREEVLPRIGHEDDMRYNAVVATHNELMDKFRALLVCVIWFERGDLLMLCSPRLDTTSTRSSS
jgi:phage terminase large subunit-like protein